MEQDDIQIELGQSVRRHIESKKSPLKDGAHVAAPYCSPTEDQIPVFVAESVMRAIERHAASQKDKEIGGVLLGGFFRSDEGSFVEVTDSIEAKTATGTDVSFTFTHETWEQINAEQSQRAPESEIVGWYHSHPALGVFMSRDDEFIHTSYFADPWHVALVVDPTYHNWGCFKWRDGALERTGGFYIFGEKKTGRRVRDYAKKLTNARQPAPRSASAAADRTDFGAQLRIGMLWLAVCLLLITQIVLGYLVLSGRRASPTDLRAARDFLQRSVLCEGERSLSAEIAKHPTNREAYQELQTLNAVLDDPGIRALDNDRLDRINLMVWKAEALAQAPVKDDGEQKGASHTLPVEEALKVYKLAEPSRNERLDRAERLEALVEALPDTRGMRSRYRAAVDWLRDEHLREIALGRLKGEPTYIAAYGRLNEGDRKRVDKIEKDLKSGNP